MGVEMIDSKRRACLALQAIYEGIERDGTRTVFPVSVVNTVLLIGETPVPEQRVPSQHLPRFFRRMTTEELHLLIDEYEKRYAMMLLEQARQELTRRTSTT